MDAAERFGVGLAAAALALSAVDVAGVRWPGWYVGGASQAGLHAAMAGAGVLLLLLEPRPRRAGARGIGIALLSLAALATLTPSLLGTAPRVGFAFEALENLAHAMLGAWGVFAARR